MSVRSPVDSVAGKDRHRTASGRQVAAVDAAASRPDSELAAGNINGWPPDAPGEPG